MKIFKHLAWLLLIASALPASAQWIQGTAVSTTSTVATISWTTCAASSSSVSYGLTSTYGSLAGSATLSTGHSVTLSSLQPSTTYHFSVSSADSTGVIVAGKDSTFTTAAAPVGVTVSPTSLTFTAALNTDSVVKFITVTNLGSSAVPGTSTLVGNGQFTWGNQGTCNGATLPPGSCTISIKYHPTAAGSASGTLTTHSGTPSITQVVTLTGTTTAPPTHSVQLSWTPSASVVTGYNIYRGTVSGGPYSKVGAATGTAFTDVNVPVSDTLFYVATAVANGLESVNSNQFVAVIP